MNQSRADLNLETGKAISLPCIGYVKQRWGYVKQRRADHNLKTDKASHFCALYWVCETEVGICETGGLISTLRPTEYFLFIVLGM